MERIGGNPKRARSVGGWMRFFTATAFLTLLLPSGVHGQSAPREQPSAASSLPAVCLALGKDSSQILACP